MLKLTATHLSILNLFAYHDTLALANAYKNAMKVHGVSPRRFQACLRDLYKANLLIEIERKNSKRTKKNFTTESIERDYGVVFIEEDEYTINETKKVR
ncbi:hypothetical protein [Poseidonibacter ostreae]|uniref:Uncharacterized protein n=1 Tax=Poseidonibacter ostreae TaxID=2654171 RepID=A0A6L4WWH6_9BACT|nr:hypothetical protein [Poseidonibacter ostreae]KAB7891288.1 hypothetical protein GBG19_00195 [Poseidonibacter ostreae]